MQARKALIEIAAALIEAVKGCGPAGCPAGELYSVCMTIGMPLEAFNAIMGALVKSGHVTKYGHLYVSPEHGYKGLKHV